MEHFTESLDGMGWSPYDMGLQDNEFEQIKEDAKAEKKENS